MRDANDVIVPLKVIFMILQFFVTGLILQTRVSLPVLSNRASCG
jgi:hypothetical protein